MNREEKNYVAVKEFVLMLENTPELDLIDRLTFSFTYENLFFKIMEDLGAEDSNHIQESAGSEDKGS